MDNLIFTKNTGNIDCDYTFENNNTNLLDEKRNATFSEYKFGVKISEKQICISIKEVMQQGYELQ